MKTRAKWPWVPLVIVAALALWFSGVGGMTKERAERELAAELPPGTDQAAVRAYFQGRGIRFDEVERGFVGRLRNVNRSLIVQKDLMLIVDIDTDDKVARTIVTEYLTGL